MARALIEGLSILAFMAVMAIAAMHMPRPAHDPISPDFHLSQGR